MNENEQYLLALKALYDEVALIDFNAKTCHVLSAQTILFYETDVFDIAYLELIAKKIAPQEQQSFLEFFNTDTLRAVWQSETCSERHFLLNAPLGFSSVQASLIPIKGKPCVLYALKKMYTAMQTQEYSYEMFLCQFLRVIDPIFDEIIELNQETSRVRVVHSKSYEIKEKNICTIDELLSLYQSPYVHEEDRAALLSIFFKETSYGKEPYKGTCSIDVRFLINSVYVWTEVFVLSITLGTNKMLLVAMQNIEQKKLLQSIVDRYVYKNCDYFIYLNADKNSYIMFSGSDDGTPLPPVVTKDYSDELVKYAHAFVAPEDVEMVIREMQISRVLEQLDKYGEHSFSTGILDPVRGYTRKRLQYIYYDKLTKMILLTRTDITKIYEEEKKLEMVKMVAQTDSLTGLYNHKFCLQRIQEHLSAYPQEKAAVLFIDFDNFKRVNDELGHQCGDDLLVAFSKQLKERILPTEIVGRIGGDEFVIFLAKTSGKEVIRCYVQQLRKQLSMILTDAQRRCGVTCSIGVALYPKDGSTCVDLINKADIALYRAKKHKGKNKAIFFSKFLGKPAFFKEAGCP